MEDTGKEVELRIKEIGEGDKVGTNKEDINMEGTNMEDINMEDINKEGINTEGINTEGTNKEGTNKEGTKEGKVMVEIGEEEGIGEEVAEEDNNIRIIVDNTFTHNVYIINEILISNFPNVVLT